MGETGTTETNNDQATVINERYCLPSCKYEGKPKKGSKVINMLRCCTCMQWFHEECLNIKNTTEAIWNCTTCSSMPGQVIKLLQEVLKLQGDINIVKDKLLSTEQTLEHVKQHCETLKEDNRSLQNQIEVLAQQLQHDSDERNSHKQTLLIGDSLIRDFDESKLKDTHITCVPGAKVSDVLHHLRTSEETFDTITVCVGTNDCATDSEFDENKVVDEYKEIINCAKTRVIHNKRINISSIPPRSDSEKYQEHIDVINACLSTIASDNGVSFINNDMTFKLNDGSPNDGYLQSDGIHLSFRGTNRLAKNLKVKLDPRVQNGNIVTARKPRSSKGESINSTKWKYPSQADGNGWNTAKNGNRHKYQHNKASDQLANGYTNNDNKVRKCWFCGESNHISQNCRHGKKITCHSCNGLGHKAKFCEY